MCNEIDVVRQAGSFFWNYNMGDLARFSQLSLTEKIGKMANDCISYSFFSTAYHLLGTKEIDTTKRAEILKEYTQYIKGVEESPLPKNQDIILVLNAEEDKTDSFAVSPKNFIELEKQSGCKIVIKRISKLQDIKDGIDLLGTNRIKALWIRGHGEPESINFSTNYRLGLQSGELNIQEPQDSYEKSFNKDKIKKLKEFFKDIFDRLDPSAPIILEACSTGKELEGRQNVAQFVAQLADGRSVYAPSRAAVSKYNERIVTYTKEEGFKVNFESYAITSDSDIQSLSGRLSLFWNMSRLRMQDVTCIFKG